jgi:hypothetical protein
MRKVMVVMREYQRGEDQGLHPQPVMPVLMGGSVAVQILLKDKVDTKDKRIAIWTAAVCSTTRSCRRRTTERRPGQG